MADYEADSLAEATPNEPKDGVYTVTNTYHVYKTLKLDAHLDRLEDSARRARIELALDRRQLRASLRQMIDESGYGDVRFRITAPRDSSHLIISMEPYLPLSPELYQKGVRCVTVPDSARDNPNVKATEWMHIRDDLREDLPPHAYEVILLDTFGNMLEGASSNFFAILNSALHTADKGALAGIARQVVFEVAPGIMPLHHSVVNVCDIPHLSEAFITSSSRGIVPVVAIDDRPVGDGTPGKTTKALRRAYSTWAQTHLEDL